MNYPINFYHKEYIINWQGKSRSNHLASIQVSKRSTPTFIDVTELNNGGAKQHKLRPCWSYHLCVSNFPLSNLLTQSNRRMEFSSLRHTLNTNLQTLISCLWQLSCFSFSVPTRNTYLTFLSRLSYSIFGLLSLILPGWWRPETHSIALTCLSPLSQFSWSSVLISSVPFSLSLSPPL